MPDWLPENLAELVLFKPIRIVLLIIAAFVLRRVLRRLINRSLRRAIDRPLSSRSQTTQKLITDHSVRGASQATALGARLAGSEHSDIRDLRRRHPDDLGRTGLQHHHDPGRHYGYRCHRSLRPAEHCEGPCLGIFMLVEDQLGVGDYVDMDKASGVVEAIGLRVTELRGQDGTVWYVRNGEVLRIGNFSQGGPGQPPADASLILPAAAPAGFRPGWPRA